MARLWDLGPSTALAQIHKEAKRSISNGVDWIRKTACAGILRDLSTLETLPIVSMIQTPSDNQQFLAQANKPPDI